MKFNFIKFIEALHYIIIFYFNIYFLYYFNKRNIFKRNINVFICKCLF